jgi:predicted Rossmann fold flavoprotein
VAIVGAGAAGLATAIFTRRDYGGPGVVVLDGARKPGAKILVSGGGRCNVTNVSVQDTDFWGGPRPVIRRILRALPVDETVGFFREIGVTLHEEEHGKLFPDSNRARQVLDALLAELEVRGGVLCHESRVLDVARRDTGFEVTTTSGVLHAQAVVLATGGRSLPKSGSDGAGYDIATRLDHTIVPTTVALAPLILEEPSSALPLHVELSGVSHETELTVWVDDGVAIRLTGSLLWTHFGVSGPVALNASRHWERARLDGKRVRITASFYPGRRFDWIDAHLLRLGTERPKLTVQGALSLHLPVSVVQALVRRAEVASAGVLSRLARDDRRRLSRALVEWPLPVAGARGFTHAEATAGGVALTEIDPATMESRRCPGLYLVGEILDVDGRLGGFNFQWAWSSARVAARGLAARFERS